MLDEDGYPDEKCLKAIEKWDIFKKGVRDLLDLVEENTNMKDWSISIKGKRVIRFEYFTGGWSGNEDVISALRQTPLFWSMFWQKSTRGGHYYFVINASYLDRKEK